MEIRSSLLKNVIYDRHAVIRQMDISPREYTFEPNGNYVLTGLRRAGKSTLLYGIVQDLIKSGLSWDRIIYINFEDERLAEFTVADFDKIISVQAEMSAEKGIFFFDEIQIVDGWERFARRLADAQEHVYITGSNAKMLSRDVERALGGRYLSKHVRPFNFREYLCAMDQPFDDAHLLQTRARGKIIKAFDGYLTFGGFPESLRYVSKREYVSSIYQNILLGDIIARNSVRNVSALQLVIKKIAESVREPISFTKLYGIINAIGLKVSKDTIIDYVRYAEDAYLIFELHDYYAKFVARESNSKYYFSDNGLLNLFLDDKASALLENIVAITLLSWCGADLYYLKSAKTGIDVDFFDARSKTAVQVAYELSASSRQREVSSLVKLAKEDRQVARFIIVTYDQKDTIRQDGVTIKVIPAYRFCLHDGMI